jgi:hypothetical protein
MPKQKEKIDRFYTRATAQNDGETKLPPAAVVTSFQSFISVFHSNCPLIYDVNYNSSVTARLAGLHKPVSSSILVIFGKMPK